MNSLWRSRLLSSSHLRRHFSVERIRNVWISGLIDPRNTTLPERQLIYNERLVEEFRRTKELRSSLALENTTIQSAITFISEDRSSTIIDTADSFVDFTIDVQAALRAFDGAVLVLSSLHDLQTQSIIIHQQMSKLHLPKLIYIDQEGSDPFMLVDQVKSKLHLRCAAVQLPIDTTDSFAIPVDLVEVSEKSVEPYPKFVLEKRLELIETVSEVDDELAQDFRSGNYISASDLEDAIRRSTIARKFVPIFMGNAKRSRKCLRELLIGVESYLPSPIDVSNYAFDHGEKVELSGSIDGPFVALAFTMEHRRLCKLTYLRIYQGVLRKGDFITNVNTGKTIKVSFLVRRYSDGIVYGIDEAHAGKIVAVFDVDCSPGDTFTDGSVRLTITPAYSEK